MSHLVRCKPLQGSQGFQGLQGLQHFQSVRLARYKSDCEVQGTRLSNRAIIRLQVAKFETKGAKSYNSNYNNVDFK